MLLKGVATQWHGTLSGGVVLGLFGELPFSCEIKFVERGGIMAICTQLSTSFAHLEEWSRGMVHAYMLFI